MRLIDADELVKRLRSEFASAGEPQPHPDRRVFCQREPGRSGPHVGCADLVEWEPS